MGNFRDPALPLEERVADLLARLTTGEKVALLHQHQPAVPRLGLAAFTTGTEALHGVAWLGTATVFPQAIGLASTWNPELVREVGAAVGTEVRGFHAKDPARGLNVWAPVVNPLRDPRWGRNEEGYSEDPLLTSVMGTAYARGLRGDHPVYLRTAPTLKHFLGYNNETDRCTTSSGLRDRVLREYELPCFEGPFSAAVAVMPSYNLVNGRPAHLSEHLPDVAVVSDAMAPSNVAGVQAYHRTQAEAHAALLRAGVDSFTDHDTDPTITVAAVTEALDRGLVSEADVDRAVRRVLGLRFALGEFDPPEGNPYSSIGQDVIDAPRHRELALEAARQSIVLLRNDGLLPLGETGSVAVIGTHAGVLYDDWYSGTMPYQVTPFAGIAELNGGRTTFVEGVDRVRLRTPDGYLTAHEDGSVSARPEWSEAAEFDHFEWGGGVSTFRSVATGRYLARTPELVTDREMPGGWEVRELFATTEFEIEVSRSGLAQAISHAVKADVAIVVVGNDPHINGRETQDRADLDLPQAALVRAVRRVNPRTMLVVVSSYPYALDESVPAILWSSHGGQELGRALAEVVFGRTNPSGRLTQTWYRGADQLPDLLDYDVIKARSTYLYFEGDPLYEFGHGLSYTTFSHGEPVLSAAEVRPGEELEVAVEVTNTGDWPGAEVVQLYGRQRESRVPQPIRRLLAFQRVHLAPGERRMVRFVLRGDDFWHWDVVTGGRVVETATHELWTGPHRSSVRVLGERVPTRGLAVRAEHFDDYEHVTLADETKERGTVVESARAGAWLLFRDATTTGTCTVRLAGRVAGRAEVRLRLGSTEVAVAVADLDADPHSWQEVTVPVRGHRESTDLYVVFDRPGVRLAALFFL